MTPTPNPNPNPSPITRLRNPAAILTATLTLALLTLTLVFLRAATLAHQRRQPVVERLDIMTRGDPARRLTARNELVANPDTHAPILVSIIRQGKNRWHAQILPWLDDIPHLARRRTRQVLLERQSIEVLQRMGPSAAPHVLHLLPDTQYGGRELAVALLRSYGTPALPLLLQTLDHPNAPLRAGAATTLGRFPAGDLGSLDPLRRATTDPHPAVRAAAVQALGQMLDRTAEIVPDLVRTLDDPSPEVQIHAATALRSLGNAAIPAIPALRRCLAAQHDPVRAEAALTLADLDPAAARAAAPDLLAAMDRRRSNSARLAAIALVRLNQHPDLAFARLAEFLADADPAVRTRTLEAVRPLGPAADPLVPAILALLQNRDTRDDRPAVLALRAIRPEAIPEPFRQRRRTNSP